MRRWGLFEWGVLWVLLVVLLAWVSLLGWAAVEMVSRAVAP